jgi:hypothetical protein
MLGRRRGVGSDEEGRTVTVLDSDGLDSDGLDGTGLNSDGAAG